MHIGVFGGSFDPIHNAHLIIAQLARESLGLGQIRLVVAGEQPQKLGQHLASAAHRLAMVKLAIAGVDGLVADDRELSRPNPSYTIDTLRSLRQEFPAARLVLLLGSDSARGFATWREPAAIRALAAIAVCRRNGETVPPGFDFSWDVPAMELSSAEIRSRAMDGKSLAGWVPGTVADYIAGLRLYGSSNG